MKFSRTTADVAQARGGPLLIFYRNCSERLPLAGIGKPNPASIDLVSTASHHKTMRSVGIKQLKSRLSEYLRLVRSGETLLVTDRDKVVAELRPTRRQPRTADSLDELLDSLAERGEITRASLPKRRWKWKAKGLGLVAGSATALLDEIRADKYR
jgi:antitoxin (DNA-binding transcriptional repressor) of toxin-antitoxin stability system